MEAVLKVNRPEYNRLWNEKWKLLERKYKVDEERTMRWKRTQKPNPPLDHERRDLYHKITRINEHLKKTFPKRLIDSKWFQGLLAGILLVTMLSLGYAAYNLHQKDDPFARNNYRIFSNR